MPSTRSNVSAAPSPYSSLRLTTVAPAVTAAMAMAACGKKPEEQAAAQQQMPAVPVGVVVATPADVGLVTELPGRVDARRVAQIRARSAGIVQERLFKEGSDVKAGQVLYRIDPAPYQATLQSAKATQARAEANQAQALAQLERYRPLVAANAISKQDFVNAEAAYKQAQADVAVGKASVRTAEINLGYTSVTAPISGRIGQSLVTEGALVGQGEATPLAVVQQINPVYVNFTQSSSEAFRLRRAMEQGKLKKADGAEAASVEVRLDDGTAYELKGKLLFTDLTVDSSTGQVTLRAEVPNPKGLLLPGMYVRVRMEQAQASNAIAVPQQAVTRTETGDTVSVVSDDGKITKRQVKVTTAQNNQWLVSEGLQAGEKVMVDGFQKLQMLPPGTPVKPVPWQPEAAGAQKPAGAAAPAPQAAADAKPADQADKK
ncbi:efflux transporter, RND family, MFP subunit [Delftia acidovorans]|uniref:efflux RND transporter periplasmic adaptor subunit n=1 Tax=Delftia acidovorans TaxID=80866 RepID=UPI000501705E|nr:efflux RND transporter periplasmic adaptor subunit [Delftia acidovorans]KFJ13964.1 efflux transporter, RND family, MFP subunit [Delftia acidovorans]QQB49856.1 efflux RND transporter periplasmic adaptor subunit [Delftia acidovorans]